MHYYKIKIPYIVCSLILLSYITKPLIAGPVPPDSTIFPGMTGQGLINLLVANYKTSYCLSDDNCRDTMYAVIDIEKPYDSVRCVYTGFAVYLPPGQDPSIAVYQNGAGLNCEHTWPDAYISGLAERDLHHLFPTKVNVNSYRSNHPFKEIPDEETDRWFRYNENLTSPPPLNIRDQYSELDNVGFFEVRENNKGNIARAMFYILTMYKLNDTIPDSTWWYNQRLYLYAWHCSDPADSLEIARTRKIAKYQQNKPNPFILDSTLIRRAFFPHLGVSTSPGPAAFQTKLLGNQPNPFTRLTEITYSLSQPSRAEIIIYNVLGLEVKRIFLPAVEGQGSVVWNGCGHDGRKMPPGIYFYQLKADNQTVATRKMTVIK